MSVVKLKIQQFPSRPSLRDCALRQRFLHAVQSQEMTVMQAYEEAAATLEQASGRPCGTCVNSRNEVRPIQGLVAKDEKPARPLQAATVDAVEAEEEPIVLAEELPGQDVDPEVEVEVDEETARFEHAADEAVNDDTENLTGKDGHVAG